ncbi:MAG TPA: ABC transporter permease [Chthonomonadaceae bacterium]|nr:ABC transporter permease [Chthonomonadaceae bacterium]
MAEGGAETTTGTRAEGQSGLYWILAALRPWLVLALVCSFFSLFADFRNVFWTRDYLPNVFQQSARNVVLAVGMSFVIMTGGIDLSVGSVLALAGVGLGLSLAGTVPTWLVFVMALPPAVLVAWILRPRMKSLDPPAQVGVLCGIFVLVECLGGWGLARGLAGGVKMEGAIAVCLLIGLACGLANGLGVALGRIPPFVMTLGMMSAARGLTLYATDGSSVPTQVPRFMALGQGGPLSLIALSVVALGALLLTRFRAGRTILAIGGNEQAARLSGVDVVANKTLAYGLAGLCAGIGAVMVTAMFGQALTNAGTGAELEAIAAVVIGGTRLTGGQGSIVGALVGALTITVITAGLVLIRVPETLQQVILGGIIVLTVFIDQIRAKK